MKFIVFLLVLTAVNCSNEHKWQLDFTNFSSVFNTLEDKQAIKQNLEQIFSGYNIQFTEEKASERVYFGGTPEQYGLDPAVSGVGNLDCLDQSKKDAAWVFTDKFNEWFQNDPNEINYVHSISITTAHEIGHTFGLQHTDNPYDIMYPTFNQAKEFIAATVIEDKCQAGNWQDSPAILRKILD